MALTKVQKEVVETLIIKAVKAVNRLNWLGTIGNVSIFKGKLYDVIKVTNLMTNKETFIGFCEHKSGLLYKANNNAVDKRLSLNVLESSESDIVYFLFPILNINLN